MIRLIILISFLFLTSANLLFPPPSIPNVPSHFVAEIVSAQDVNATLYGGGDDHTFLVIHKSNQIVIDDFTKPFFNLIIGTDTRNFTCIKRPTSIQLGSFYNFTGSDSENLQQSIQFVVIY